MEHAAILLAGVMLLVSSVLLWIVFQRIRVRGLRGSGRANPVTRNLYPDLRDSAFARSSEETGAVPCVETPHVFGVIVELVLSPQSQPMAMTLVSFVDGATSLYFDTGRAVVGGGDIAAVAAASRNLVSEAEKHLAHMTPSDVQLRPAKGAVRYYAKTFEGILSAEGDVTYRADGSLTSTGPLASLLTAADEVLTQLRLNSPTAD